MRRSFDVLPWRDVPQEECGVAAVKLLGAPQNRHDRHDVHAAELCLKALLALQHRGQESAGCAAFEHALAGPKLRVHRGLGRIKNVFKEGDATRLPGGVALAHTRYSTSGETSVRNAQPHVLQTRQGSLALAHNGNLVNAQALKQELLKSGATLHTSSDSELILQLLAQAQTLNAASLRAVMDRLHGAYSFGVLAQDSLFGARDPKGFRPLCVGVLGPVDAPRGYVLASETCALDAVDATLLREVAPGEIVRLSAEGIEFWQAPQKSARAFCAFESVYFSHEKSTHQGKSVGETRQALGRALALESPALADVVVAVPASATPAATGLAAALGLPLKDALHLRAERQRTFTLPTQRQRDDAVRNKFRVDSLQGLRVILVDDSMVRGTTAKPLVALLRSAGAAEVHLRIASPMLRHPCFMGVDLPEKEELIARAHNPAELCELMGADSLSFLSQQALLQTLGEGHCHACFSGEYPTSVEAASQKRGLGEIEEWNSGAIQSDDSLIIESFSEDDRSPSAYREAGVDIQAGHRAVALMKDAIEKTHGPEVLAGVGAFGGVFALHDAGEHVLAASTDGVGTKVRLAARYKRFEGLGADLVHHCVNDILVQGAKPLFFLNAISSGRLVPEDAAAIVRGIAKACEGSGCALLGGETAEMPGVFQEGEIDIVGTIVGRIDKLRTIESSSIRAGDIVLALPSSGLHTNGFSLVHHLTQDLDLTAEVPALGCAPLELLLEPHRSYLDDVNRLFEGGVKPKGLSHITGGGLVENPPRILPKGLGMTLERNWKVPALFDWLQVMGSVSDAEMHQVFNMGVGLLVVVDSSDEALALSLLDDAWRIGEVNARKTNDTGAIRFVPALENS